MYGIKWGTDWCCYFDSKINNKNNRGLTVTALPAWVGGDWEMVLQTTYIIA